MEAELQFLIALAFTGLLVMLRLDAQRFGAAEFDTDQYGLPSTVRRRIAWYALGIGLVFAVYLIFPTPSTGLLLRPGGIGDTFVFGMAFAVVGVLQVIAIAWLRGRGLRMPSPERYPEGLVNAVATAFIDEATFRGIILALLLATGMEIWAAVVIQAIAYALATRSGAPGRETPVVLLMLFIGIFGGWLTIITLGIGAAFIGHAATRFALFLVSDQAYGVYRADPDIDEDAGLGAQGAWRTIGAGDARSYQG